MQVLIDGVRKKYNDVPLNFGINVAFNDIH